MEKVERGIWYNIVLFPGLFLIWLFNRCVNLIGRDIDVIDASKVPFDNLLKDNLQIIKEEFEKVYLSNDLTNIEDFYKVNTDIGIDDQWKAFPFLMWNNTFERNIRLCPNTFEVIKQIPGCTSAMYSVLLPYKHIKPHFGVYKGVMRCLFTLSVKKGGDCWIRVDGKQYFFEAGEAIYFDEVFEHEVKNNTDEIRAVLYLDLFRKFPFPLNLFNKVLFYLYSHSPYMKTIINEYQLQFTDTIKSHTPVREINL